VPVFKILHAAFIAPGIKRFVIEAPRTARKHRPGQLVILRLCEQGERIPLTIERSDPARGTINICVQSAGKTTHLLNSFETGDRILDVVGPLGKPSEIENFGTVVVIGGGVGTAMAYPTAAALKKAGNCVISIVGARNKELVILEQEMAEVSDTLLVTTDDGSYAEKGFVTDKLRQLIKFGTRIDLVLAVGPIPMMKAVADVTRRCAHSNHREPEPYHDRRNRHVRRLPCADRQQERIRLRRWPGVDAHRVNFEVLVQRNAMYREAERRSMADFQNEVEAKRDSVRQELEQLCALSGGAR
jgi:ferredoxin--NADP+ reductase